MREYGRSVETRMTSDGSPPRSSWRMVTMALWPAVPPPTMTWRRGLPAMAPSPVAGRGQHARRSLGGEVAQPVHGLGLLVEDGLGRARDRAGRIAAAEVALEGLVGIGVVEDGAVRAGN